MQDFSQADLEGIFILRRRKRIYQNKRQRDINVISRLLEAKRENTENVLIIYQ